MTGGQTDRIVTVSYKANHLERRWKNAAMELTDEASAFNVPHLHA